MKIKLLKDIAATYKLDLRKGTVLYTIETPQRYLNQTALGEVWVGGEKTGITKLLSTEYEIVKE